MKIPAALARPCTCPVPVLLWTLALASLLPMKATTQDRPPALERPVALQLDSVPLGEALTRLQRATGTALVYSPDLVPVGRLVSCDGEPRTLGRTLEILLEGTGLTFDAVGNQVRLSPRPTEGRREGLIVGYVIDGETGEPIPDILIQLSDGRGTLSNESGRFILVNVAPGVYGLTVTGLGWEPENVQGIQVRADSASTVEVGLTRRVIPLSALVVAPGTFSILDRYPSVARQTLTREQIEAMPQVGEDVFRSLKRLPGIASGDISTRLYLRGGQDRETLILLDGMELYEPYHLKDFEGALGIVDIHAVGGIDLHAGGFPVEFGDRSAGVFEMKTRHAPTEGTRTTLGLSITNATVMSQGAFARGKGQWLFSARRGYMDLAFRVTDVDPGISPRYYDLLGKVKLQLGSRHLLSVHMLHAGDNLELDTDALEGSSIGELATSWGNHYGWLNWKAFLTPRIRAETVASLGRISRSRVGSAFDPGRVRGPETVEAADKAHYEFFGLKQDWTLDVQDNLVFRTGVSVNRLLGHYDYSNRTRTIAADADGNLVRIPDSVTTRSDPAGTELEAYGALRIRPAPWGTAEVGLRYDRRTHTGDSDLSPRVHALLDLGHRTKLRGGWGVYHQSQGMHELEAGNGETSFAPSERAKQLAIGVEHELPGGIRIRAEAYGRHVDRPRRMYLNLWREILPFPELDGDRIRVEPSEARAKGLELLLQKNEGDWNGSASYALASTEARIDGRWVPQYWDQTHAFSLTVAWKPKPRWSLSAAFQAHSGWPFTPQIIEFDTLTVFQDEGLESALRWREEFGALNSDRLPTYHRLDLRATRSFALSRGTLDVYVDLFNAYDQRNVRAYEYGTRLVGEEVKWIRFPDEELLPFLPSIGLRWEF